MRLPGSRLLRVSWAGRLRRLRRPGWLGRPGWLRRPGWLGRPGWLRRPSWLGWFRRPGWLRWLGWPRWFRRRWGWRRILRVGLAVTLLMVSAVAGVVYAMVQVPYPDLIVQDQASVVTYADGTPLATWGGWHRIDVPLSRVPVPVRQAVLAAENRDFYGDHGFSPTGTVRAAINNVRGGPVQGGSTITQQYVKNAYLTSERTLRRKLTELAVATKLNREHSKDQILEWYLNTVCFGRGAFGVEAAAETYFGKQVQDLTVAEGAVLASSIRSPTFYDPQTYPDAAQERWEFVLGGMVQQGWLDPATRAQLRYPRVLPRGAGLFSSNAGPNGLVLQQVREELARNGFDEARLNRDHLRVTTTLDSRAQRAALDAMSRLRAGQPRQLRAALVALDPRDGAVRAYHGGTDGTGLDYLQSWRQPGSTFKPIALAAALNVGIPVWAAYDGSSPRTFYGLPKPLSNSDNAQCRFCTLVEATTRSINTAYYDLALTLSGRRIAEMAHRLGIPPRDQRRRPTLQEKDGTVLAQIVLGRYEVRPYDLVTVYATLAAGGVRHEPYLVKDVIDSAGRVVYRHRPQPGRRVVNADVANDVGYAMRGVLAHTGHSLRAGRVAATKTGTVAIDQRRNKDAWMAGYTPQLATVVWVGTDRSGPIRTAKGKPIEGGGLPAAAWQRFTDAALAGQATVDFAPYPVVGADRLPWPSSRVFASDRVILPEPGVAVSPGPTGGPLVPPKPTPARQPAGSYQGPP
jgi:membrane peptidoglycan carboxypeptidase